MVVDQFTDADADRVFQALSDSTRRDIIRRAMDSEQSVSGLARHYAISLAAVQKHVAVLERASLIRKERRGREQIVHGNLDTLHRAARLLEAYEDVWRGRAERLGELLSEGRKGTEP
jgi:DNA-binding transcriptional ArsR family regulator